MNRTTSSTAAASSSDDIGMKTRGSLLRSEVGNGVVGAEDYGHHLEDRTACFILELTKLGSTAALILSRMSGLDAPPPSPTLAADCLRGDDMTIEG